ncbi:MAG TPA: hypothetical protein VEC60_21470 [Reyranella sp.]|nr:hypothetical protein [Reyranella sp.]
MSSRTPILLAAGASLLAACSTTSRTGRIEDTTFGDANKATFAAQVVDPDPQYEYLDPATSGEHSGQAIERYRKDAVKRPERVRSTATSGR